ncbi:MAG: 16S rRNA (guanine(966)-N(2))-methyltransferase RsmD [Steroidobacteraceae bacterium]
MKRVSRELRIIAGAHRGRKIRFPDVQQIRPTPDRVRETLFNWLAPQIIGARCLDLFAGSGALGLEALSRGAASVVFVERDATAAAGIRGCLVEWQVTGGEVLTTDALQFLAGAPRPFDIVFLDPPFAGDLLERAAEPLERFLAPDGAIYVEAAAGQDLPSWPSTWQPQRAGKAGEVGYHLLRVVRGKA